MLAFQTPTAKYQAMDTCEPYESPLDPNGTFMMAAPGGIQAEPVNQGFVEVVGQ